jgi:rhodanese-related sulfurtransferase
MESHPVEWKRSLLTSPTPALTDVDAPTLREWIDRHDDLIVVDVRSAAEFEGLHIKGSYNVPLPLLSEHADELAERLGRHVVLVCQSGVRAGQARTRLNTAGLENAVVLTGGVPAFEAAGGDVVRGAQRWSLERQVRMAAGSLVLAGLVGGKLVSPKVSMVAGAIGAGLTFSAATNTCAMGNVLSKMPWNKSASEPTAQSAIQQLP